MSGNERTEGREKQRPFVVPRAIVVALVDDFLASRKGREKLYCSSFDPDAMRAAFSVPVDPVDYGEASRTLDSFRCPKMTAYCDSWTPWMRNRLNANKLRRPAPLNQG